MVNKCLYPDIVEENAYVRNVVSTFRDSAGGRTVEYFDLLPGQRKSSILCDDILSTDDVFTSSDGSTVHVIDSYPG